MKIWGDVDRAPSKTLTCLQIKHERSTLMSIVLRHELTAGTQCCNSKIAR